jgi:hypothetical protein
VNYPGAFRTTLGMLGSRHEAQPVSGLPISGQSGVLQTNITYTSAAGGASEIELGQI